jgi:adenosylhomocysteine nucleosidase
MNKVIFVALKEEFPRRLAPKGFNVVYTGIGKVNATLAATQYLTANPHCEAVYNYGTAGAGDDSVAGELLGVSSLVERDMDITALGLPLYVTEKDQEQLFYTSNRSTEIICGTGDSFARPKRPYHIVDMEAYAIGRVCEHFGIPEFYCFKYISDTDTDVDPGKSWKQNVAKGAKNLEKSSINLKKPVDN